MKTLSKLFRRLFRSFRPSPRPLPWRPFHEKRLPEGPHHALYDRRESMELRAVMEVIEETIAKEADSLSGTGTVSLERAAGMFEAYLELHRRLVRMVERAPRGEG